MKEIDEYQEILAKELTPELAAIYVQSLLGSLTSVFAGQEIVRAGEMWHYKIGNELYGPLICQVPRFSRPLSETCNAN